MAKLGLFVAGVLLLAGCRSYKPLEFRRIDNLRIAHFDFSHPQVTADVIYYNPNGMGFDFRGGSVDVHLDTLWLGHANLDTSIHVSANSEFTITLPITLDLQRLIASGLQTYLNRTVDVKVDGIVRGSKAGIVKTFPVHYEGQQNLNLKLF
ncbi:MAG TPA: LEA type 2 family protein [Dinghuibacter sp.]|uniref:LEA type 2 family protein n=1 Tax=Dinghuibacter sp. TaxID=2024697 RepID=UPI002CB1199B|nr:LEA type 2 family protein [Dinghuibacter sp.]HTJ13137.1 LEA type 2 family protein [Dinghuibacter sp.]